MAMAASGALWAQIPGVVSITTRPVDFPTPESVDVLLRSDGDYEATFQWQPETAPEKAFLVGTFNSWSRTAEPMLDPDKDGVYTATVILSDGDHEYKFYVPDDNWIPDPGNSSTGSMENSLLRLGISALLEGRTAAKGDGELETRAILHDQGQYRYLDAIAQDDIVFRLRTVKNDATSVEIEFFESGRENTHAMRLGASDELFDYYEYHRTAGLDRSPKASYRFLVRDGEKEWSKSYMTRFPVSRFKTPDWARDAIWYQIMPDRFRDGDPTNNPEHTPGTGRVEHTSSFTHDPKTLQEWEKAGGNTELFPMIYGRLYGGDFQGTIDKLDYLKDLGINAIYFNPIFEATSHHKYNAKDYRHADDGLGVPGSFAKSVAKEDILDPSTWEMNPSDEKFLDLLAEAKKRGMRVIIDGVFNHLGDDSVSYLELKKNGKDSPLAGWYDVISWDPVKVSGWAGHDALPQFRKDDKHGLADESLREYIFDVTRRWMDPNGDGDPSDGIDGWRLDVPMDVPMPFWVEWRRVVKETNPDAYIVGEVWDFADEWLDGTKFDAVMNYRFRTNVLEFFGNVEHRISPSEFDNRMAALRMRYPRAATAVMQNLMDSHDTDRIASRLMNPDLTGDPNYDNGNRLQDPGNEGYDDSRPSDEAYRKLRLIALFQATYVGAPMIWYGTEIGMYGADDPLDRNPMWWDDLGPRDNPDFVPDTETFSAYRQLFALRSAHESLRRGDFTTLLTDDEKNVYAFLRSMPGGGEAIAVVINQSSEAQTVEISAPSGMDAFEKVRSLYGDAKVGIGEGRLKVSLSPLSGTAIEVMP